MKKYLFLIVLILLSILVLTGCEDSLPEMVAIVFSTATPVPTSVPAAPATETRSSRMRRTVRKRFTSRPRDLACRKCSAGSSWPPFFLGEEFGKGELPDQSGKEPGFRRPHGHPGGLLEIVFPRGMEHAVDDVKSHFARVRGIGSRGSLPRGGVGIDDEEQFGVARKEPFGIVEPGKGDHVGGSPVADDLPVVTGHGTVIGEEQFQFPLPPGQSGQLGAPAAEPVKKNGIRRGMTGIVPSALQRLH